jgi:Zn-dependent protease/CBS domain-containing protein
MLDSNIHLPQTAIEGEHAMGWSIRIARVAGIDVKVHWTFAVLLVWLAAINISGGKTLAQTALGVGFVLAIFVCVVLHEFGHALVARRFGIRTADITLLPIGGLARLQRMPEDPKQEFWIAVAGPMVNVLIVAILFPLIWLSRGFVDFSPDMASGDDFWMFLLLVNLSLVVFNMIPAFPMDGGRILRSLLAQKMDYVRATGIAASVGQLIAVGFGIFGYFYNAFLMFIGLFVFLGARAEATMVSTRAMLGERRVRDAMLTRFVAVSPEQSVGSVVDELLAGEQQDFPVIEGNRVIGMVRRSDLVNTTAADRLDAPVRSVMEVTCTPVSENAMLRDTLELMQHSRCRALPVERDGRLVGLLTEENVAEWLMIRSAQQAADGRRSPV